MVFCRIGYPRGLETVSSEEGGKRLYAPWLAETIPLSLGTPSYAAVKITNSTGYVIEVNKTLTTDQFKGGYCKIRSGVLEGTVYKIDRNTSGNVVLKNFDGSYPTFNLRNDYAELVTGPATYTFPENRAPYKRDVKIATSGENLMLPYYNRGIAIPINYENDFVINCRFTDRANADTLLMFTKLKIDYGGNDALATNNPAAPMILEWGSNAPENQYLVHCDEAKEVRTGGAGNVREISLYFKNYELPSYRGY